MKIPGFSQYDIDTHGTIKNIVTGEVVPRHKTGKYDWVTIRRDDMNANEQINLHVLMALAFCGPKPEGGIVCFLDGNCRNVEAANIAWTTRSELGKHLSDAVRNRRPKTNNICNEGLTNLLYDTLCMQEAPVSMVALSDMLQLPYSAVRYSMYGLIAAGKARAVKGGYVSIC